MLLQAISAAPWASLASCPGAGLKPSQSTINRSLVPTGAKERFDLDASEDILPRVFFTARGYKLILLLHGYDKGVSPGQKHQQNQIKEAAKRLTALDEREKAAKKAARRGQKRVP